MSKDSTSLLEEISNKVSQLISLTRLANSDLIRKKKEEVNKDLVCVRILELSDGTLPSNQFKQKISTETNVSEKTVQRSISELIDVGALIAVRKGREIYYQNSGLLD